MYIVNFQNLLIMVLYSSFFIIRFLLLYYLKQYSDRLPQTTKRKTTEKTFKPRSWKGVGAENSIV